MTTQCKCLVVYSNYFLPCSVLLIIIIFYFTGSDINAVDEWLIDTVTYI